jgi:hypothetical protein
MPVKVNRRFGETCRLHLHGRKVSHAGSQYESGSAYYMLLSGFLLALFFGPENGGDMFL